MFEQQMKWSRQYPYAFPLRLGPFYYFLTIHHPDYVKSILSSSGMLVSTFVQLNVTQYQSDHIFICVLKEPKDKLTYELIESASGKTVCLSFSA